VDESGMEDNKSLQKCKGTRDLPPDYMKRFRLIEGMFRDCCRKWGYDEVKTPTLEYLNLFTTAGTLTSRQLSKVYSFLDWDGWSGERVVLRPEATIPIARYYIESGTKGSARLCYVSNIFKFEATGTETREIWQCGAELIGAGSTTADAELVCMALEVLKRLGLKNISLRLSHAGIIRAILSRLGISEEEQSKLLDRILDGDLQALIDAKPELERIITPVMGVKGKSSGFLKNVLVMLRNDFPDLQQTIHDFIDLADTLDNLGIAYEIDMASGHGFEYYTGLIFELWSGDKEVGRGGRYDALIGLLGGQDVPASGFAMSIDRTMQLLGETADFQRTTADIIVKPMAGTESLKEAFIALDALHSAGFGAELALAGSEAPETRIKWLLKTNETGWRFSLNDLNSGDCYEVATVDEVIAKVKARSTY
jgi:histidyl-tRNA synthetase